MRKIINLSGNDWQLKYNNNFINAQVPGEVHLDLLNNKIIDDLFYGKNIEKAQWISYKEWIYKKKWKMQNTKYKMQNAKLVHLLFYGIDYSSSIYLNDKKLCNHIGMFSKVICDVSDIIREENELVVILHPFSKFKNREKTLRMQLSYGWDMAPRLLSQGIWDKVELILTDGVFIKEVLIRSRIENSKAIINFEINLISKQKDVVDIIVKVEEKEESLNVELIPPLQKINLTMHISNPKLWQPYERGKPYLYTAEIIIKKDDKILDCINEEFGIRKVKIDNNLKFFINDEYLFIRGANLVPLSILPGSITQKDYEYIINKVKAANINLLRIHGGGLKEKQEFYKLCDKEGILIWQEFPFACVFGLLFNKIPTTKKYLKFIEEEITSIVKQLCNHPSVVLFCAGNEFSKKRNKKIIDKLKDIVTKIAPDKYFHLHSPDKEKNEIHNWFIWHAFSPITDYKNDNSQFVSEFGLQALPNIDSLKKFIPKDNLYPIKPSLLYLFYDLGLVFPFVLERLFKFLPIKVNASFYYYHNAQLLKIFRYVKVFSKRINNLEQLIKLSQLAQDEGLKIAIEYFRRRKNTCYGCIIWQLNDVWPCISWSIIDYYGIPKQAYYTLCELYKPVILSLEYDIRKYYIGDNFTANIFIINDLNYEINSCSVEIVTSDDKLIYTTKLNIKPNSVELIDKLRFNINTVLDLKLKTKIVKDNEIISKNSYLLNYEDKYRLRLLEYINKILTDYLFE